MTKAATTFDFADLDISKAGDRPFEFEINHPQTEKGLGVFVSVVGAESNTFQSYMREEANKVREDAWRKRNSKKADEMMTVEREEDFILAAIAHCMTGWRTEIEGKSEPIIFIAGERMEFNQANAVRWLKQFRWVRQQVNDATADLSNFITA